MQTITSTPNKTIHLQSYGLAPAKPAIDFKVGDVMLWNFGYTSVVTEITNETEKMITYKLTSPSGYVGERKFLKTRLVAFNDKKSA